MSILLLHIQILADIKPNAILVLMLFIITIAILIAWAINRLVLLRIRKSVRESREISAIMQHTLDMGKNYVLKLNISRKYAFNLHGDLLPEDGMSYEASLNLIHPDDLDIFKAFIKRLYYGETQTDECVFRWDMSGQKRLGQWCYMHDQGIAENDKATKKKKNILARRTENGRQIPNGL